MKLSILAAMAAAAALAAAGQPAEVAPPLAPQSGSIPADGYFEKAERVAEGVWVIRQGEPFHIQPIGNVVVIEQADGLVLVDSGGSPGSGRRIVGLVRKLSPKPVKAVVLSHWHGDHTLGLSAIRAAWPRLEVVAHRKTAVALSGKPMSAYAKDAPDAGKTADFMKRLDGFEPFLARQVADASLAPAVRAGFERTQREFYRYRADTRDLYLVTPTRSYDGRLVLADPIRPVELIHPGRANTEGDTVAWLPKQKVLIAGDLVVAPVPFGFNAYPADWVAALNRLRGYDFQVLIPGHGPPQRDRAYLDRVVVLIGDVRAQVAPLARQGLSLEEARTKVDLSRQAALFTGGDPWLERWFKAYWADPFTEAAWKEAKGVPIEQGTG